MSDTFWAEYMAFLKTPFTATEAVDFYSKNYLQMNAGTLESLVLMATVRPKITGKTSDGYHTFDELYDHRITLFINLCSFAAGGAIKESAWRSKLHSDGKGLDSWFILGLFKEKGKQITYHLPISRWEECDFAETLERAPEWDGHTSADVLFRLKHL